MRLDIPDEIPLTRLPERPRSDAPLEPSPVELRLEALAARAADRRPKPSTSPHPPRHLVHEQKSDGHAISRDRAMDRRPPRQTIPPQALGLSLRAEEQMALAEVGRFRVITKHDLAETIYQGRRSRMERDLTYLRERELIHIDTVNARRDGRGGRVERIEVVTLTKAGLSLARMSGELPRDQRLYAGLVKPREVEHDAQIYRAYRKEAERIEQKGGANLRVRLDFELKSQVQKAIHAARKANPEQEMAEIKQQVAHEFDLPFVNRGIQIPDARIEYDRPQGAGTGHEDIEVLTAAYRPGHLRNKAQAGFHVYASAADRATLTAKIEDDRHLMERVLEL